MFIVIKERERERERQTNNFIELQKTKKKNHRTLKNYKDSVSIMKSFDFK